MAWSIRELIQSIITRLYIYGINPIEVESALKEVEKVPLVKLYALEEGWVDIWRRKSDKFITMALEAEKRGHKESAKAFRKLVMQCDYAASLINSNHISFKQATYKRLEEHYQIYTSYLTGCVKALEIPFRETKRLKGYLHLPSEEGKYPCMVLFAGEGSSKEELHMLARAFVKRNIAVFTWDTPGTGSSLFEQDIKNNFTNLKESFNTVFKYLKALPEIDENKLGTAGLCMGGGYAYYAAANEEAVKCCVNFFPLLIKSANIELIPHWMKAGKWANYQRELKGEAFANDIGQLDESIVTCDYLLFNGKYDNWMSYENTMNLYHKAQGKKKVITVEEELVFQEEASVGHTMPVGEQIHWIKHIAADWASDVFKNT